MRVRMLHQISGTYKGSLWPAPGEEINLPSEQAATVIKLRMAEAVEATTKDAEDKPKEAAPKPAPKPRGRPRKTPAKPTQK